MLTSGTCAGVETGAGGASDSGGIGVRSVTAGDCQDIKNMFYSTR